MFDSADVMRDGGYQQPYRKERDEKADRSKKQPTMRSVRNRLVDEETQTGAMEQEEDHRDEHEDKY
jgi:hypothetical protein